MQMLLQGQSWDHVNLDSGVDVQLQKDNNDLNDKGPGECVTLYISWLGIVLRDR